MFYVTADLNIEKEMIKPNFVERWNDTVEENDCVIIMGNIGNYSKNLNFSKINGIFYLVDGTSQEYGFSTLRSMGIDYVWTNEFKIKTKIGGEESIIYIGNFEKNLKKNEYLCCGEKINNKVQFTKNCLSVSYNLWGCPIKVEKLADLIQYAKNFSRVSNYI